MKESVDIDCYEYRVFIKFKCKECGELIKLVDELVTECEKCGKRYILDIYESAYQPNEKETPNE